MAHSTSTQTAFLVCLYGLLYSQPSETKKLNTHLFIRGYGVQKARTISTCFFAALAFNPITISNPAQPQHSTAPTLLTIRIPRLMIAAGKRGRP